MTFSADGGRLMTGLSDHTMALWSASGNFLARLAVDENDDWVIVTSRGYFHGTPEGLRMIGWKIAGAVFPVELYAEGYRRPELVARALMGALAAESPETPVFRPPPQVRLFIDNISARTARIRAVATPAEGGSRIRSARVLVDGRDSALIGAKLARRAGQPTGEAVFESDVDFPPGKTMAVVAAVVTDERGIQSMPATLRIVRPGAPTQLERSLVVLSVGISRYRDPEADLNYADADAADLSHAFQQQEGRAYARVIVRTLINEDATREGIRAALLWLQQQAGPTTTAIVVFSGHGGTDRLGRLYYVPYDADGNPAQTWLPWDEVAAALSKIRASPIVFFSDCCHAGAFGQRAAAQEALAEPLVRGAGVMVFAASRGMESSLELSSLRHGAFTYALLEGLRGKADLIPDGRITMSELQAYVANQVKQLTEDQQHPHIPLMNDFDPEYVIAHVR